MAITEMPLVKCLFALVLLLHIGAFPMSAWALEEGESGAETSVYVMPYLPGSGGDGDGSADSEDPAAPGAPGASGSPDASSAPDAGNAAKTANVASRSPGRFGGTSDGASSALPRTGDGMVGRVFALGLVGTVAAIGIAASLREREHDRRDEGRTA